MTETPAKLTPAEFAEIDPAYWAKLRKIKLQSGEFSFAGHEYQIEPMRSTARRKCYRKATQGGITEIEVLVSLHGMIHGRYPQGVLYMFPTTDNVNDFSRSRFGPLIQANTEFIGKFVKMGGKGTDTTGLKKVRDAFLYLRGARLSQSIGIGVDEKESVQLRSIPVDRVVFDEMDLMDDDVVLKARGRMGHSKVKEEVYLSNPTLPDYGIDKVFAKSDQRYWHLRCACGTWFSPDLAFPSCVALRVGGHGFIKCPKCGADTVNAKGEWVPAKRENLDLAGYHWSQLLSTFVDPAEILEEFNNPPQGNIGDVYRLRLGLPYVAAEDKLTAGAVFECCGNSVISDRHGGPCAMGVDVGKTMHAVIGVRTGHERYELVKMIRLSNWTELHDVAKRFGVKSAVIDARPYEDSARAYQMSCGYRVFLCEYAENTALGVQYNDKTGLVKVNRTEIFDHTHRAFSQKEVVLPRRCAELDEFVAQCCNTAKVLETNKRSGTSIYRYRSMGPDHYRNAFNYFLLAASGSKLARVDTAKRGRSIARCDYDLVA